MMLHLEFIRDALGDYTWAWFGAAGLCVVAAVVSVSITRRKAQPLVAPGTPGPKPTTSPAATT